MADQGPGPPALNASAAGRSHLISRGQQSSWVRVLQEHSIWQPPEIWALYFSSLRLLMPISPSPPPCSQRTHVLTLKPGGYMAFPYFWANAAHAHSKLASMPLYRGSKPTAGTRCFALKAFRLIQKITCAPHACRKPHTHQLTQKYAHHSIVIHGTLLMVSTATYPQTM